MGNVVRMEEVRNAYKISLWKFQGNLAQTRVWHSTRCYTTRGWFCETWGSHCGDNENSSFFFAIW